MITDGENVINLSILECEVFKMYLKIFTMKLYLLQVNVYFSVCTGTSVLQVTATDADDPTYGNSARVVYSILQGQPYFSVDPKTGWYFIFLSIWFS